MFRTEVRTVHWWCGHKAKTKYIMEPRGRARQRWKIREVLLIIENAEQLASEIGRSEGH